MDVGTRLVREELALNLRSEVLEELDVAVRRFGSILYKATREVLSHDAVLPKHAQLCTGLNGEAEPDDDEWCVRSSLLLQLTKEVVEPVAQGVVALLQVCLKHYSHASGYSVLK